MRCKIEGRTQSPIWNKSRFSLVFDGLPPADHELASTGIIPASGMLKRLPCSCSNAAPASRSVSSVGLKKISQVRLVWGKAVALQ